MAIIDLFFPNLLTMLRYLDLNFFVYFINECAVSTRKKRSIIAIARILAETIYSMLKNNVRYIEKERMETVNPYELYFKRLEELSLKKINNMGRVAKDSNVNGDSANLIYRWGIKDC